MTEQLRKITDDIDLLLNILPENVRKSLQSGGRLDELIEIVLDLGRKPEARFVSGMVFLSEKPVEMRDIEHVVSLIGTFGKDNRAGIERTLHRISAIRNRADRIIGLTCRVGRAVYGTIDIVSDLLEENRSVLLMGRPGVGKTTMLREMARILGDEHRKRVVIVDTSNEIAGDGDIPHSGIGGARRMQVPRPDLQYAVMIEAVENHMPEVIVVDEIGVQEEAFAARTIAERGVQLVATAHGNTLENLLQNPTLSDLVGGIQAVTLSDEEARRRHTQKTVLERKAPPTFDVVIEIKDRDNFIIHNNLAESVDLMLRGRQPNTETRFRNSNGEVEVLFHADENFEPDPKNAAAPVYVIHPSSFRNREKVKIYPYGVSRNRLEKAIASMNSTAVIVKNVDESDLILTLRSHEKRDSKKFREAMHRGIPVISIRSNTVAQLENFIREYLGCGRSAEEEEAVSDVVKGIEYVLEHREDYELRPRTSVLRRLQHEMIARHNLFSSSSGKEPNRRVNIFYNSMLDVT